MQVDQKLDCKGLSCPMPIIKLAKTIKKMDSDQVLEMIGTDPGSKEDVPAWCEKTGNTVLETKEEDGAFIFYIKKK
ncbi:MAG: sulfurtransferase TusA family protein [Candidatus Cloacimonetes bacterium]|jgi:tRNA 2-thiouridine synthesizing protein A|nr:sulfurtransferase TusA family protein [Candidatus Cloacimonadota bacterium]MBT7469245.1 sulfurtransferase TusA family protein [Candidatus Cloacimonadota bacterium]